jgi:hypothetical protein
MHRAGWLLNRAGPNTSGRRPTTMTNGIQPSEEDLAFWRRQSAISSPGTYAPLFDDLPNDLGELCRVIQGLIIHQFWIIEENDYGITAADLKAAGRRPNDEINLRSVEEMLAFILQLEDQPLTVARPVDRRVVGNCRHYALMLVSMLRQRGVPARVRSGVGRYFWPGGETLEDHFITEFWNQTDGRWQRVDPQIDDVQRKVLRLTMDTTDFPPNQFLDSAESYVELQSGKVKPDKIGIFDFRGWPYVHYKLVSDLACLCSVELLPWEGWGICPRIGEGKLSEADEALLQHLAEVLAALPGDPARFAEARELFETHPDLQVPEGYEPERWELEPFK